MDHHAKVLHYIRRRVDDHQLAEDLVSDVFAKAIDAQRRGKGAKRHVTGWLYRIAHNLIVDHYRSRERRPAGVDLDTAANQIKTNEEPLLHAIAVERQARLQLAMGYLTREQQVVMSMRLQGYPFVDIAADLDLTVGATKALLHRGKTRLQDVLKGLSE